MLHLRLHSPALSTELKRRIAFQLTEAVLTGLGYTAEARQRTFLRFMPYDPDDIAVGGELVNDGTWAEYALEVTDHTLNPARKRALVKEVMPVLMQNFALRKEQSWKIAIVFHEQKPSDIAVGGVFLDELDSKNSFRLRMADLVEFNAAQAS